MVEIVIATFIIIALAIWIKALTEDVKDLKNQLEMCEGSRRQYVLALDSQNHKCNELAFRRDTAIAFAELCKSLTDSKIEDDSFWAGVCSVMEELDPEWESGPINLEDLLDARFSND